MNGQSEATKLLLIEDDDDDALLLRETLLEARGARFHMERADRLETGLERLRSQEFDIVLLDLKLPDSHGLDTLVTLHTQAPEVPILVLTGLDDEMIGIKAVQEGAQDYLVKGYVEGDFLARPIRYAIERYKNMEALQASEERLRRIIEHDSDAIVVVDHDGVVRFTNPAAESIFDRSVDELMGEVFGFPIATGEGLEIDILGKGSKTRTAEMRVTEMEWEGKPAYLASLRDVTERKEIDCMKNELISITGHELRSPLTSILNALNLIADGKVGEVSDQARRMIDIAYRNSERLLRLINNMLDIEKIEAGMTDFNLQPQKLMPLLRTAIEANRAYATSFGIELALRGSLPDVKVNVDSDRLIQVITNLLSNAIKFSPPDGTVDISISHHGDETEASVRINITDKGPGIPEEFRDRVFQKFAQACVPGMPRKGGSGLGLSIAKAIVEKMDGQIGFETETGAGTTFYLDLPEYHTSPVYQMEKAS